MSSVVLNDNCWKVESGGLWRSLWSIIIRDLEYSNWLVTNKKTDETWRLTHQEQTFLSDIANVVMPGATWAEKAGTFENVNNRLQAFERAIDAIDYCKSEAQIALDLTAVLAGVDPEVFNPAATRQQMADIHDLREFLTDVHLPAAAPMVESDMQIIEV